MPDEMTHNDAHGLSISTSLPENIGTGDLGTIQRESITWCALRERLSTPYVDQHHSADQYASLDKDAKFRLKNRGYFVGGTYDGSARHTDAVASRTVIALDVDHLRPGQITPLQMGWTPLCAFEFLAVTTRSHAPMAPRWRVLIPLAEPISAAQYEPVARILAARLFDDVASSMDAIDRVSFDQNQAMFLPSRSHDQKFGVFHNAGVLADGEAILAAFGDWQDHTRLPQSVKQPSSRPKEPGRRPEDPTLKTGPVGDFCRAYDIHAAIAEFLPTIYLAAKRRGNGNPRYTYAPGEGSNGAVVLDDGARIHSRHDSDPAGGRQHNAFDLVRLHLFGALDAGVPPDTRQGDLPSFQAMVKKMEGDASITRTDCCAAGVRVGADQFDDLAPLPTVAGPAVDYAISLGLDSVPTIPISANDDGVADLAEVPGWVRRLNSSYAVAVIEGDTVILHERPGGTTAYGSLASLHAFHENDRRKTKTGSEPATKAWMRHEDRRQYPQGVTFAPGSIVPAGTFNTWRGFAVDPDPGSSCALFLAHARDIICDGNPEAYGWLLGYLGHMVQHPEQKPGVAVVLRGRKGAGKDTIANYLGKLFPPHHTQVSHADHLTGRFNAHQAQTLLLHLEEGFWAGSKQAESSLKHIITSDRLLIEPKGVNAFTVRSVMRVFITSNESWIVPAGIEERRFFVLNVASKAACDPAYSNALRREMEGDGPAALLHHLQNVDLSDFDPRNPPMTQGLMDQKLASLRNIDAWWHDVLNKGELATLQASAFDASDGNGWTSGIKVPRAPLRAAYRAWLKERRYQGEPLEDGEFGKSLTRLCPSVKTYRQFSTGERAYVLPPLLDCREAFEACLGAPIEWDH
jgi:hypothetical protein